MKFKLKPYFKNQFPKKAVLVCNPSPKFWLQEIQRMGFHLEDVSVFPVPSSVVNQLYGCLIIFNKVVKEINIERNIYLQNIHNKLLIPENTIISPLLSLNEMQHVFSENYHVYHPDFGLVELEQEVDWLTLLSDIVEVNANIIIPSKSVTIPKYITSLRIEIDEETILKELEESETDEEFIKNLPFNIQKVLKGNQREVDKLLKYLEKHPEMALKIGIPLDTLNSSRGARDGKLNFGNYEFNWFGLSDYLKSKRTISLNNTNPITWLLSSFFNGKYMILKCFILVNFLRVFLLKNSASEVVKFILISVLIIGVIYVLFTPTDNTVYKSNNTRNRISDNSFTAIILATIILMAYLFVNFISSDSIDTSISPLLYIIGFLIFTFFIIFLVIKTINLLDQSSFFSNIASGRNTGNSAVIGNDKFNILHQKYENLAQEFISKKEYEKAAHVYMKLLKNNHQAAVVLENGNLFQEAATVYLKYCQNKNKAAECYEKGKAYKEAIALYKEFGMTEKVGDLYLLMNEKATANEYFYKVVDDYKLKFQYVKASLVLKNKIEDITQTQIMLLEGWRANKDAGNCLNNYFNNIKEVNLLKKEIKKIYAHETPDERLEIFLNVLKKEFEKHEELKVTIKDIAYEIVAKRIIQNPHIASELYSFNKKDKNIIKDVLVYKFNQKKQINSKF
jgi:hypothetical protein